jgi:hypothetical protein
MLLSAGGDIDAVESADFIAQEPKLRQLKSLNDERGGTLLSFFKLQDEDSQQNMSSAILGALFRNLMFHQPGQADRAPRRRGKLAGIDQAERPLPRQHEADAAEPPEMQETGQHARLTASMRSAAARCRRSSAGR